MHFFIDHAQLTSQATSGDGFGPSSADPTNKYDVSANFQLASDAKAFACQAGHIIITDFVDVATGSVDATLINVILKPTSGLGVNFPSVKYYVYRGIRRDSFFSGGSFNAEGSGNTDTVRKMWEDWHANNPVGLLPVVTADLGFDAALDGTVPVEEIFGGFRFPLRAREVSEGEWIGNFGFTKKIAFEVIVEAELLDFNMGYARKSKVQIDVSAMTAITTPTPAQIHALRCEKDKILAFVDPAAFFGMHFSVGVSGFGLATAPKGDALATTFLSHFSTATRVYIDIRSEKGYSYNFYGNYGGGGANPDLIQIKPGAAAAFVNDPYSNQGWPLFSKSGWTGTGPSVNLVLQLRIDDNTKPLLFVEDTDYLPGTTKNFLDDTMLLNGAAVDWSKPFTLKLNASGSGTTTCVATHVRLQYLRQRAGAAVNPRLLQFNHRLDTVFGGIDLPILGGGAAFGNVRNEKVGLAEGADFAHVAETGMYFDADALLLYGSARVAHRTNKRLYPTAEFTISTLDSGVRSAVFPRDIVFSRWSIVEGGVPIKLIDLNVYKKGAKNTSIDGIYFLGLKRAELTRLQATTGFGPVHQRFLVFEEAADRLDDSGFPYRKYEVKVQGLDPAGQRLLVAPSPAVFVFGAGANMFCSNDFASAVSLPDKPPDAGLMKPWEFAFSGTYQHGDAWVDAVELTGIATVSDIGNDFGISHPTVKLRARYFFPIDNLGDTTLSGRQTTYPAIVIVHGNGHAWDEYDALGQHLAQNGFIVAAVNLWMLMSKSKLVALPTAASGYTHYVEGAAPRLLFGSVTRKVGEVNAAATAVTTLSMTEGVDFDIETAPSLAIIFKTGPREFQNLGSRGRAEVVFKHLAALKNKFGAQVENKIGLIGHSRGGEGVLCAARLIGASTVPPTDLRNIAAIISLGPTDRYEKESLTQDIPYFVLYGSQDTDVSGYVEKRRQHLKPSDPDLPSGGPFAQYDRALNTTVKSMAFVYGASHNGFITNSDKDPRYRSPTSGSKEVKFAYLVDSAQNATALAYMNAFMRRHMLGEMIWKSYFTGEFIPGSTGTTKIFLQYKEMASSHLAAMDNFEDVAVNQWNLSSIGKPVVHNRGGTGLVEGSLRPFAPSVDLASPHDTFGLKIAGWAAGDTLTFTFGAGKNVVAFSHLSFRITQVAGQVNSKIDDLKVVLEDTGPTPATPFAAPLGRTIPDPDPKVFVWYQPPLPPVNLTKSAFLTVRIPLSAYAGVNLSSVKSVRFEFPKPGPGNIEIDDVEFTL